MWFALPLNFGKKLFKQRVRDRYFFIIDCRFAFFGTGSEKVVGDFRIVFRDSFCDNRLFFSKNEFLSTFCPPPLILNIGSCRATLVLNYLLN